MMAFQGTSIARYLSLFEQCLDLPARDASSVMAEVRTHLEDAVEGRSDLPGQTEEQATRLLGSPRHLAARLTIAQLQGSPHGSWWAVTAWRRWRAALRSPKSRLGAMLAYLGPMAFIQFTLPTGGWSWLAFLAVLVGLFIAAEMFSWAFARLTRPEALRVAVAGTAISALAAAFTLGLAAVGDLGGNIFALVFWPIALLVAVVRGLVVMREGLSEAGANAGRPPLEA